MQFSLKAAGIEGDLDQLAEALIPVFMGEGDSDVAGHRLERGEITLNFFLSSLGDVEKEAWAILHPDSKKFFGDSLQPKPEMHDFVTEIKKGGFKTGLISNNVKEWQPAWDKVIPPEIFLTPQSFRRRLAAETKLRNL